MYCSITISVLSFVRFVALSPIKTPQWPRVTAGSCPDLSEAKRHKSLSDLRNHNIFQQLEPDIPTAPAAPVVSNMEPASEGVPEHPPPVHRENKPMSKSELTNIWKSMVLERFVCHISDDYRLVQLVNPIITTLMCQLSYV